MFHTFASELPWTNCNHPWNSKLCRDGFSSPKNAAAYSAISGSGNITLTDCNLTSAITNMAANLTSFNTIGDSNNQSDNVTLLTNESRSPTEDFFMLVANNNLENFIYLAFKLFSWCYHHVTHNIRCFVILSAGGKKKKPPSELIFGKTIPNSLTNYN